MSSELPTNPSRDGNSLLKGKRPELIELIADTLHSVKAYDLPAECERLGLTPGTGNEAHSSKRVYVRSRLQGLSNDQLLQLARQVERDHISFRLTEFLRLLGESNGKRPVNTALSEDQRLISSVMIPSLSAFSTAASRRSRTPVSASSSPTRSIA